MAKKKTRVLILRYKAIGDTLLDIPLVKAICRYIKDSEIYFVTEPQAVEVIMYHPCIKEIFAIGKDFFSEIKFLWWLVSKRFDIVFDNICYPRSAFNTFLTFAPIRIGRPIKYRSWAYNLLYQFPWPEKYQGIQRLIPLERFFGIYTEDYLPDIYWTREDEIPVEDFFRENRIDTSKLIVLNPNAYKPSCMWIPDYFVELAKMLIEDSYYIVLTAGPGEEDFTRGLLAKIGSSKAGMFRGTLLNVAYLLKSARLFVTGDTGLKVIATATRTPTITIYGPYDPWVWNPPDTELFPYFITDGECKLCRTAYCKYNKDMQCMREITPNMVYKKAKEMLEKFK